MPHRPFSNYPSRNGTGDLTSQNNEDNRLWNALSDCPFKSYVDIGAGHPTEINVTKLFYDAGWRGINVEPGQNFDLFAEQRPEDNNIKAAVSNQRGDITFYHSPVHPDLSTVVPTEGWSTSTVFSVTLADVFFWLSETCNGFLKVDVEGHEYEVLSSNNWEMYRPWVVVVEAIDANTLQPNHFKWEPILLEADYNFAYFDGINRFYYRSDHPELEPLLQIDLPTLKEYPR